MRLKWISTEYAVILTVVMLACSYSASGEGANHEPVICLEIRDAEGETLYYFPYVSTNKGDSRYDVLFGLHTGGENITIDISTSYDPDRDELTYFMDLGDGTLCNRSVVSHRFENGTFDVNITLSDGRTYVTVNLCFNVKPGMTDAGGEEKEAKPGVGWFIVGTIVVCAILFLVIIAFFRRGRQNLILNIRPSGRGGRPVAATGLRKKRKTEEKRFVLAGTRKEVDPAQKTALKMVRKHHKDEWDLANTLWSGEVYKKFTPDLRRVGEAGMEKALYATPAKELDAFCKEVWNNKVYISGKTQASLKQRGGTIRSAIEAVRMLGFEVNRHKAGASRVKKER